MNKILATAAGLALMTTPAWAVNLDPGEPGGVTFQINTTVSLGANVRMEDQDPLLIGRANTLADGRSGLAYSVNGDDGNLEYDKGDVISTAFKATTEITWAGDTFGLYSRLNFVLDKTLFDKSRFEDSDYAGAPSRSQGPDTLQRKRDAVRDHVGNDGDVLDLYLFADFDMLGRYASVRVGRQIINWGESTFVLNGLNSLISLDANQLRVPGFDVEEIFIPVSMFWGAIDLFDNVSAEVFYQLDWESTIIDASGTYWSTNDFAGIGGSSANLGFGQAPENAAPQTICTNGTPCVPFGAGIPRLPDQIAKDGDQFGGALRFFVPALNDADVALYAANYHSRLPVFSGVSRRTANDPTTDAAYFVQYPEDIKLYGASFNTTTLFDIAIQGELSVKQDQPLQIDDVELLLAGLGQSSQVAPIQGSALGNQTVVGFRRHDVTQIDIGLTKIFGPWNWAGSAQQLFLFEIAGMSVSDFPSEDELRYEGPGTYLPGDAATAAALGVPQQMGGYPTETSWGYIFATRWTYNNVFNRFVVEPALRWQHDVDGISPTPLTNFVEDRKVLTGVITARYLNALELSLSYTQYSGAGQQNLLGDRDFASVAVKYSF